MQGYHLSVSAGSSPSLRVPEVQRAGQGAHLTVGPVARAREQRGEREPLLDEELAATINGWFRPPQ